MRRPDLCAVCELQLCATRISALSGAAIVRAGSGLMRILAEYAHWPNIRPIQCEKSARLVLETIEVSGFIYLDFPGPFLGHRF